MFVPPSGLQRYAEDVMREGGKGPKVSGRINTEHAISITGISPCEVPRWKVIRMTASCDSGETLSVSWQC